MTYRFWPFFIVAIFAIFKLTKLFQGHETGELVAWAFGSAGWLWIMWAYWKDRDMVARSGNFKYQNGENDFARTFYAISMVVTYVIAVISF
jgi:hypothetical protein